jgi:hypothetical protein
MFVRHRFSYAGSVLLLFIVLWGNAGVAISTVTEGSENQTQTGSTAQQPSSKTAGGRPTAASHDEPECLAVDHFFADEVWAKVGERTCLKCHNARGDASDSDFVLRDTGGNRATFAQALRHNRAAFQRMAAAKDQGKSRLLLKIKGDLDHGGGVVLKADSTGYQILNRYVLRTSGLPDDGPPIADYDAPPFFDGIEMMSPRRLLRRVTLSLVGRLPTRNESAAIKRDGLRAMDAILDDVMTEDAFYERLQEAFNDILLTRGYDGVAEGALSYEHFKSRLWYKDRDPGGEDYSDPKKQAYVRLVRDYREGMLREPFELVTYIVRNDRPFTEIVTADYIMVSPYTSKGYGIFEELQDEFDDPDDPFEFIPAKLQALKSRNGRKTQESVTGFYPHAGLLSSFQYLKRYPTSETNRNRLRVRMYFQHFLGIDIMQLAPRVNDAAAITATYKIPTMQAADCVVCHKFMDPIAGLFQDYYVVDGKGIYGPRKEGWYEDMFSAGFEGEALPDDERWRSLQWLGERTANDPRFAVAMVKHVWYILTGRKPLLPPEDIDDPLFAAKRRAYRVQRDEIEEISTRFVEADFNLKVVFKELVQSKFYRADGVATAVKEPRRLAELHDVGVVRMLTPEQLERKLLAVFGKKWGRLVDSESKLEILYGGIDSKAVTERMTDPSGAMGAIQRIMANDVACKNVAADFSLPAGERTLFPEIELNVAPGNDAKADARIRRAIVYLHERLLGREHPSDHPEVERTYNLFAGIISDAETTQGLDNRGSYACDRVDEHRLDDPNYTLRAWRGVVTYLLRQHDFLYE